MISQQSYNIGRRFPNDVPIIIHNFPDEYPNHSSHFAYWRIMGIMMNYGDYPNSSHFIYRSSATQAHGLQPWKKNLLRPRRGVSRGHRWRNACPFRNWPCQWGLSVCQHPRGWTNGGITHGSAIWDSGQIYSKLQFLLVPKYSLKVLRCKQCVALTHWIYPMICYIPIDMRIFTKPPSHTQSTNLQKQSWHPQ